MIGSGKAFAELEKISKSLEVLQEKEKIVVQVGQCSHAVGGKDYLKSIVDNFSQTYEILEGGCDGACFAAPRATCPTSSPSSDINESLWALRRIGSASFEEFTEAVDKFFADQFRITLNDVGQLSWNGLRDYIESGGFKGLASALNRLPQEVIDVVSDSGLRGRGGAYFPVGDKWRSTLSFSDHDSPTQVIINAEEGEPGIFKDRHLMEGMPYRVIEGALITAYAVSARDIYIYVNAEAELSYERLNYAVNNCIENGLVGNNILGTHIDLNVHLMRGAGGYVCGEESTLINTMEGKRREPRLRPPFPTEVGLHDLPTVINNVETICTLPFILREGFVALNTVGTADVSGTKIVSLSGSIDRSGVAEVQMGTSLRSIIESIGGTNIEGNISAVAVGGPSSGILPTGKLDLNVGPGFIDGKNVMIGAGGIIALGINAEPLRMTALLSQYNADESCGKCTPCREGTPRIYSLLREMEGLGDNVALSEKLKKLCITVNSASLCGLGQAAGNPALSYLEYFAEKRLHSGD